MMIPVVYQDGSSTTDYYTLYKIFGEPGYYDLSNGSLSDDSIGTYHMTESYTIQIYSAEALLNAIESNGTVMIYTAKIPEEKIVWRDAQ